MNEDLWGGRGRKIEEGSRCTSRRHALQVKACLTCVSYGGFFFFLKSEDTSLFLHRPVFNFIFFCKMADLSLGCLSALGPCEVFTLKRQHTSRLNKTGALLVSQEGIVETALLLLSENKGFSQHARDY